MSARRTVRTLAIAGVVVAACWTEREGDRREVKRYTVVENTSGKLVLKDETCATRTLTLTPDPKSKHQDAECLAALTPGAHVTYSKRRMVQGCMPGKVYWTFVDECPARGITEQSGGTDCAPSGSDPWR